MLHLAGIAKVMCLTCQTEFGVDAFDLDVNETGSEEREDGEEIFYFGQVSIECPNCRQEINIAFDASEYPYGAENYREITIDGGEIVEDFRKIAFEADSKFRMIVSSGAHRRQDQRFYSLDDDLKIYLPEKPAIITNLHAGVVDLITEVSRNPTILHNISDRKFEELIAHVFSTWGFSVELTKRTRDGGRDVIALRNDLGIPTKYIIECKRYAMHRKVGVDIVRALYGVHQQEGANKSIVATTSRFTKDAQKFATTKNTTEWAMSLKDYDDIYDWVKQTASKG